MHARVIPAVAPPLRWVMWAIPVFLFLIGFFHRAAPGVIARDLMRALDATRATIRAAGRHLFLLLFGMGLAGRAFVPVGPIGREVNPPHLDGVAVAVVNFGGFLSAALTQGPIGAVLDTLVDGARRYPVEACRDGFAVCAAFPAAAAVLCLLRRTTPRRNIYGQLREPA
jgi:hypothetical protein